MDIPKVWSMLCGMEVVRSGIVYKNRIFFYHYLNDPQQHRLLAIKKELTCFELVQ